MTAPLYQMTATLGDGQEKSLGDYAGRVLLVVNTASQCGFTPQYQGLQILYDARRASGFEILAFPCNQFGRQEPGTDEEIARFCHERFGITFPIFRKVDVNGAGAHPIFVHLKAEAPGLLGKAIRWNFTKFLVDRSGRVVERFAPSTAPAKLDAKIRTLLR